MKEGSSVREVLLNLDYQLNAVAVVFNGAFIPRQSWSDQKLYPDCALQVIAPMQGG